VQGRVGALLSGAHERRHEPPCDANQPALPDQARGDRAGMYDMSDHPKSRRRCANAKVDIMIASFDWL
jgi:hypothetical protein